MLNRGLSFRERKDREVMLQILYRLLPTLEGEEKTVATRLAYTMKREIENSDKIYEQRRKQRRCRGGRYDVF